MYYAKNIKNDEIVIASGSLYRYLTLVCPVCGEDVYLRAGSENAPHFAHYGGMTSPECSLYTPHSGLRSHSTPLLRSNPNYKNIYQNGIENLAIFLCQEERGFQLQVRIPSVARDQYWDGTIFIQSSIGERSFKWEKLKVQQFVSVSPSLNRITIKSEGHICDDYWSLLKNGLKGLNETTNWFHTSSIAGRLLSDDETIFWGESYWILLKSELRDIHIEPRQIKISESFLNDQWLVLEVTLPPEGMHFIKAEREAIEGWCRKTIKSKPPKSFLLDPLPRGFDIEGSFIIPSEVEKILLEISGEEGLLIIDEMAEPLTYSLIEENVVSIDYVKGSIRVFIGDTLTMKLTSEEYSLPSVPSIMFKHDENVNFLYELSNSPALFEKILHNSENISLSIPIQSYEQIVTINGKPWAGNENLGDLLRQSKPIKIDAKGFGCCVINNTVNIQNLACPEHLKRNYQFLLAQAYQYQNDPSALVFYRKNYDPDWLEPLLRKWPPQMLPQVISFFQALSNEEVL